MIKSLFGDGATGAGAVYLFTREGSTWTLESKLTAPEPEEGENFGEAMRLDEGRLFVGAPGGGAVHYFEKSGMLWEHRELIRPSQSLAGFGEVMDINRSTLAVAHFGRGGGVYVFEFENDSWIEKEILRAPNREDCMGQCGFGAALSIDGDSLAISQDQSSGSLDFVHLYEKQNGSWDNPQTLIVRSDNESRLASIAFEGDYLAIGDEGSSEQVDIFYRPGRSAPRSPTDASSPWQHVGWIPSQGDQNLDIGHSLSMDSSFLVIGACRAPPFVWTFGESVCCRPHFRDIGDGTEGSWGFVPFLSGNGEDCITGSSRIYIKDCLGQSAGFLFLSTKRTPFHQGTLNVEAPWYPIPLNLDGQPGWPGSGTSELPLPGLREWVGTMK